VFVTLATGLLPGIIAYIVAWILMPEAPYVVTPAGAPRSAAPQSPAP